MSVAQCWYACTAVKLIKLNARMHACISAARMQVEMSAAHSSAIAHKSASSSALSDV
jgi:hypothetical protein